MLSDSEASILRADGLLNDWYRTRIDPSPLTSGSDKRYELFLPLLITFGFNLYRSQKMKLRPINIFEITLLILFIVAHILLVTVHIPFMGLITVLSGSILVVLYFYLGFIVLRSPDMTMVSSILYGVAFGIAVTGLMFTFQHWPYAIFEIAFALIMFIVLAIARLIAIYLLKKPKVLDRNKGVTIRYIVLFALLLYAFITLNHH